MGGFTKIMLKDVSEENIKKQNSILAKMKVDKNFRFYSEKNVIDEYKYYKKGDGNYPDHLFPKDKIKSYKDFTKYWSTSALGEVFVPPFGSLTFDCYFGRTEEITLNKIAKYLINNFDQIAYCTGSYSTFISNKVNFITKDEENKLLTLDNPNF
jgi:hypothetical protein